MLTLRSSSRLAATLLALFVFPAGLCAQEGDLSARVDSAVAPHLRLPRAVGLSVGVGRGGDVVLAKGYGFADLELEVPANAQTLFRIGSVTKQLTAALVMQLVEGDALRLSDPLARFVPDFPLQGHAVTIHHLLNHTSGIPSYTDLGAEWAAKWPLELSHAELLALVAGRPFDFEPGADWHYNNTGYYLLGMVLESVGGASYAELVQERICGPLDLERTRYDSNVDLIRNRAQGYEWRGGRHRNDATLGMSQPGAAGGLISTGGELVRWSMALAGGRVVSAESLELMTTPTVVRSGRRTGYGFGLVIDEFAGRRRIHHGGGIHGFNAMLFWLPDDDLHVAVISNCDALRSDKVAEDIGYAILGIERPKAEDLPTDPALRAAIAGHFHIDALGMSVRVFEEEDAPMAQAEGQDPFRLLWQGEDEFRAEFDHDVRLVFSADRSSFALHQGGRVFQAKRAE